MKASMKGIAPEWYTLESEKDEADPVQFFITPLDGMAWAELLGEAYNPTTREISATGVTLAFKRGVSNWRNIEDADNPGKQLPFNRANMGKVSPGWIIEVGQHILAISQMGGEAEKNSVSPSSSPRTSSSSPA